ncbi:hypothetical protein [Catenulispora yoronensis]
MTDPVMPQNQDPYPYRYSQSYQLPGQQPELSQQPYPEGGPEAPQGAPAWRPGAADRLRALAVGVLNLSGLGLGYVVTRRWVAAVVCWAATGALLLAVLPASPKAPPAWLLIGYLGFLVVVAVHGAVRALLRPLKWPRQTWIAAAMAVVLLVVPVGGVVLFNNARANAIQTMLLGRLKAADDIVAAAKGEPFGTAQPTYGTALVGYRDLLVNHRDSRAGKLVPDRLAAFYRTIAAAYDGGQYCDAIEPLTYLRTVPQTIATSELGSLATWPDDRLATALLRCGTTSFNVTDGATGTTYFNELMATFPTSPQAAQVPVTASDAVTTTVSGISGPDPCGVTTKLRTLDTKVAALTSNDTGVEAALAKAHSAADNGVATGTFACGAAQYKSGDFISAQTTMQSFATDYPNDPNAGLAAKYVIAAQVAQKDADAGKQPPTMASGGNVTITVANDSPDAVHILYTGSATGTFDIAACAKCSVYQTAQAAKLNACASLAITYPQASITVPVGTVYLLEANQRSVLNPPKVITVPATAGESHDYCAYETSLLGTYVPPVTPITPPTVTG